MLTCQASCASEMTLTVVLRQDFWLREKLEGVRIQPVSSRQALMGLFTSPDIQKFSFSNEIDSVPKSCISGRESIRIVRKCERGTSPVLISANAVGK